MVEWTDAKSASFVQNYYDTTKFNPYEIEFEPIPGNVKSGRTVPIRFTVTNEGDPITHLDLTVEVTLPNGEENDVNYKSQEDGRYHVNVRTARELPGDYTISVYDPDDNQIESLTFTAR
ncbi:FixH family protein [Halococcus agarilyticus]|uniref:FixH family protein n=1 Tax=Halococcus agarilyticus TaxID=1232219 RepID=UPI0006782615|nr:FixH family protein [Halococcus agarilyticus]